MRVARKSWAARSMANSLMLGRCRPRLERGGEAVDRVAVGGQAGVAGVHDHGDAGLVDPGPEGVERSAAGESGPVRRRRGGGPHDDGAGALVESPLELAHRLVHVGQR